MDFNYSAEDEAFRSEVKAWLDENLPKIREVMRQQAVQGARLRLQAEGHWHREWMRMLGEKGWAVPHWPKEYGGGGLSIMQQVILDEETTSYGAPPSINAIAFGFAGPTILTHGTEEQKKRFIPKMLSGEEIWCQGFSEPDAGSDLAALKCKAVIDGDDYVVNGQKVWSSLAHIADWQILLVRTDPAAPKHKGITYLLVDMHTPGIEVRPLKQITGSAEFNEVFYDNVRIPRSQIVGEENRGWYVAMTTLGFERASGGAGITVKRLIDDLAQLAVRNTRQGRPAIEDPAIRQRLAQSAIEGQIRVLNGYRVLSSRLKGRAPGPEAQMGKVFWSELNQRIAELAAQILGPDAVLDKAAGPARRWQHSLLRTKGNTIEMGTSEILRNVIGERILGLPR